MSQREGHTPGLVTAHRVWVLGSGGGEQGQTKKQEGPKMPQHLISASELIKATSSIFLESFLATQSLQDHLEEETGVKTEP